MRILRFSAIATLLVAVSFSVTGCFENIETNNIGISTFMGQTNPEPLPPGTYQTFTRSIYEISGRTQTISLDKMHPKTFDNLTMEEFDCDVFYHLNIAKVPALFTRFKQDLHENGGVYVIGWDYLHKQTQEVLFATIATFKATTIHQKRDELSALFLKTLQEHLNVQLGDGWGVVESVTIRKMLTDQAMEASIHKVISTQFQIEQKQAAQKLADEEAKRLLKEATGQANANKVLAASLTPELIRMKEIEAMQKFSDKGSSTILLPYGQNFTPMINAGK